MSKPPFDLKPLARALHRNGEARDLSQLVRRVDHPNSVAPEKGERVLDFNGTPQEYEYLRKIMERVHATLRDHVGIDAARNFDSHTAAMDLMAIHRNAMPLDFFALLTSSDDDLTHDVFGAGIHWNRRAGQLLHGWKPRCAKAKS